MKELQNYWQQRYVDGGTSGRGSYGLEAEMKATVVNHIIKELQIRTINEIGSGDGNNACLYNIPISYTGFDISEKACELANLKTKKIRNSLKYFFTSNPEDMNYQADMCLCLDVWYHQVKDEDFEYLCNTLFNTGKWKFVLIYSTDTDLQTTEDGKPLAVHMKPRKVMEKLQEFPEWELLARLDGYNTEDGQKFRFPDNKLFYLLRRKQ